MDFVANFIRFLAVQKF